MSVSKSVKKSKLDLEHLRKNALFFVVKDSKVLYVITERKELEEGVTYRGVKLTYAEGDWRYTSDVSLGGSYLSNEIQLNPTTMYITKKWGDALSLILGEQT